MRSRRRAPWLRCEPGVFGTPGSGASTGARAACAATPASSARPTITISETSPAHASATDLSAASSRSARPYATITLRTTASPPAIANSAAAHERRRLVRIVRQIAWNGSHPGASPIAGAAAGAFASRGGAIGRGGVPRRARPNGSASCRAMKSPCPSNVSPPKNARRRFQRDTAKNASRPMVAHVHTMNGPPTRVTIASTAPSTTHRKSAIGARARANIGPNRSVPCTRRSASPALPARPSATPPTSRPMTSALCRVARPHSRPVIRRVRRPASDERSARASSSPGSQDVESTRLVDHRAAPQRDVAQSRDRAALPHAVDVARAADQAPDPNAPRRSCRRHRPLPDPRPCARSPCAASPRRAPRRRRSRVWRRRPPPAARPRAPPRACAATR